MQIIEVDKPYFYIDNNTGQLINNNGINYDYSVYVCQNFLHGFPELEEGDNYIMRHV
jgi:hypothetical protein